MSLETPAQYGFEEAKAQLEEKVARLQQERVALMEEVESLRQTIAIKSLERKANQLQSDVESLRLQKDDLEQRLLEYSSSGGQNSY